MIDDLWISLIFKLATTSFHLWVRGFVSRSRYLLSFPNRDAGRSQGENDAKCLLSAYQVGVQCEMRT